MGDGYYILTLMSAKGANDWYYQVNGDKENDVKTDNLCENGIVHSIPGVLIKPKNALKN